MGALDGDMGGKNALKNRNMKFGTINLKNGAFSLFLKIYNILIFNYLQSNRCVFAPKNVCNFVV